ncbi:MAG: N-acetylmuramoyl-L-alanine amidase-like domain-containing protein, partial [Leadbetterella sp.]
MNFKGLIVGVFVVLTHYSYAQEVTSKLDQKLQIAKKATFVETFVEVAKSFVNTPYVGGTLEGPKESLVCNLDGLDCYTFVENCLAITQTLYAKKVDVATYRKHVMTLRYRNATIAGYVSRHHYFAEWARNAEKL